MECGCRCLSRVVPNCESSAKVVNVTEAGETSRVHELSQYSQIPLSKIHQPLRLVQAFFLEYYAVYSVAVPVGAHMWQIAGVRFHRKL